jgi:hypothetical protein
MTIFAKPLQNILTSGIGNGHEFVIYWPGLLGVPRLNILRFLLSVPYLRLLVGGLALVGIVAAATAIFPAADRESVAILGALVLGVLIVFVIY